MAMTQSNKYIRTELGFYVWPTGCGEIIHSDMAQIIERRTGKKPISAGFVYSTGDETGFTCWGESESLGIKSKPEDTDLINKQFNIYE